MIYAENVTISHFELQVIMPISEDPTPKASSPTIS